MICSHILTRVLLFSAQISVLTDRNLISMLFISILTKVSCLQVTSVALVSAYSLAWHCVNTVARAVVSTVQGSILKLETLNNHMYVGKFLLPGEQYCLDSQLVWSKPEQPDPLTC